MIQAAVLGWHAGRGRPWACRVLFGGVFLLGLGTGVAIGTGAQIAWNAQVAPSVSALPARVAPVLPMMRAGAAPQETRRPQEAARTPQVAAATPVLPVVAAAVRPEAPAGMTVAARPRVGTLVPVEGEARELDLTSARVVVHAPARLDKATETEAAAMLEAVGFDGVGTAQARVSIEATNVRFFHAEDAPAAAAAAAALAGAWPETEARDFTDFVPSPPAGTIEVWLAGTASARSPRRAGAGAGTGLGALVGQIVREGRGPLPGWVEDGGARRR